MTRQTLTWQSAWPAPAKLNLFLHVIGRRSDGYHLLQTVFRFIDRADILRFSPLCDDAIILDSPLRGVPPDVDLTVRAARLLQDATGCRHGVRIHVDKRLPVGGGLGGGSSDAATTLMALNHLWRLGLSRTELQALGLRLGADVPVFIRGRSSFAEGVGERFSDVTLPPAWYLVLVPAVAVPTVAIFNSPDLRRDTPELACEAWQCGDGHNDLEPVACALYPEVAQQLVWLRRYGNARMTGSGACCFVEFADESSARNTLMELPATWQAFVARGEDRHPLIELPDCQ